MSSMVGHFSRHAPFFSQADRRRVLAAVRVFASGIGSMRNVRRQGISIKAQAKTIWYFFVRRSGWA
jgi:hypothetical protein